MSALRMFARLTKVDVAKREVWGRITQEVVDKADEIFDYEGSKPYFEAWSKGFAEATAGKSLGNVRAMHGKIAAGKLIAIDFNDAEKAIDVGAKIVDDAEWAKCEEGVYTGFSIGGAYITRTAEKVDGKDAVRFIADPTEVSVVDNPCVPTATFDMVKADGTVQKTTFRPAALEVRGSADDVAAFADALKAANLSMADATALVKAATPAPAAAAKVDDSDPKAVDKGMWNVQDFASALACIASVAASAEADMQWEGDDSPVPEKLRAWLAGGVAIFKEMSAEEADELLEDLQEQAGGAGYGYGEYMRAIGALGKLAKELADAGLTVARAGEIAKLYDEPLGDGFVERVLAKAKKSELVKHMQDMHDGLVKMGAACASSKAAAADVTKTAPADDQPQPDAVKALRDELAAANARLAKLEAQPMPHPVTRLALRAVSKDADNAPDAGAQGEPAATPLLLTPADYVYLSDGRVDYTASYASKAAKQAAARPTAA